MPKDTTLQTEEVITLPETTLPPDAPAPAPVIAEAPPAPIETPPQSGQPEPGTEDFKSVIVSVETGLQTLFQSIRDSKVGEGVDSWVLHEINVGEQSILKIMAWLKKHV